MMDGRSAIRVGVDPTLAPQPIAHGYDPRRLRASRSTAKPNAPLRRVTACNRRLPIGRVTSRIESLAALSESTRTGAWRFDGILVERLHSSPASVAISITGTRSRAIAARGRPPVASSCTSRRNERARSWSTSRWRTSPSHAVSTMRASTPTTRRSSRALWIATCHIDLPWREHRSKYRDKARAARSPGVNRSGTRWPSVRHETTVLGDVKGALRRLRRP
jgi:hypothetical protein